MSDRLILVVSYGSDDHVELVRCELAKLGAPLLIFDTADDGSALDISFAVEQGVPHTRLRVQGHDCHGDSIRSVLFRHMRLPRAPHVSDPAARKMAESEMRWTLEGALMALDEALWLNHPNANRLARNKPLQLRLATRLGFAVPETVISAKPEVIKERYRAWNGRMIAKLAGGQIIGDSLESQYVIHTTQLTAEDLLDEEALAACPAIYQRFVEKAYELRVTVVGDAVFACRISGKAPDQAVVDWRAVGYAGLDIQPHSLDEAVAGRCRALLRLLGLEIAGLDLIVTPDGDVVFLEINAAGQWAWMEQATGLPIAAAVARRLADPALMANDQRPF